MTISVSVVDQPTPIRPGRKPRLSPENLLDLANGIQAGQWVSDLEATPHKSTAYQRGQAAAKGLAKQFNLIDVKLVTYLKNEGDTESGWMWSLGPKE